MSEAPPVLVTGGAGFLGSWVVERLLARGLRVDVVDDLSTGSLENLRRARDRHGARLTVVVEDVTSAAIGSLAERRGWRSIVHLAARASLRASTLDPVRDAEVNVLGTVRVLEAAKRARSRKVVFAASAAIYGDQRALPIREEAPLAPMSFYGAGKVAGLEYLRAARHVHGTASTSLVFANLYGPRQRAELGAVVARFVDALLAGHAPVVVGDGTQTRDFVWVGDAADAVVAALDRADGEMINVATGLETSIAGLARLLVEVAGIDGLHPVHQGRQSVGEVHRNALDPSRAAHLLGWRPSVRLADGLARTWAAALEARRIREAAPRS
ncbi:NAD-dependent epimerase/dehydratase [Acidimicrobium ferrooxidans DSM 10331]|uniref:NAD-dependent epimerase/dehydratase n=1 Tax=Acidimicrobium ferrooxidans (strain DSM 10331 / JCM 15462 / NBRC 103882 / ICP) TaxID=525909 RepID=C7LY81_ACIFD|nr:GDP-mannose 4,6-dehydratase [Acidimicrobium ferrooxidans]ACU53689.1 NAD-dependent epimerase/dehydratase [Acidimicrobium ferrooxidans DSM 10331]